MTKNFEEFHINIPDEVIENLIMECIKSAMIDSSTGIDIDISSLVSKVVAINFSITQEILRQYHVWQLNQ